MEHVKRLGRKVTRVKVMSDSLYETSLRRCLTTFDMTLLGIGCMVGSGIYVVMGTIVKNVAGPSVILAYVIAGPASLLSALCYAEFGARIPKAGSAYSYVYIVLGEIWAALIGCNMIMEHIFVAAFIARGWSGTVDSILKGAVQNWTLIYIGELTEGSEWWARYPDLLAAAIIIFSTIIVTVGIKKSVGFNTFFTFLNGFVILLLICSCFAHADLANWTDEERGGFFPFGVGGTAYATALCSLAYMGFEGITVCGEEAKTPKTSVPIATVMSILIVTLFFTMAAAALTLAVPYDQVNPLAAFPEALSNNGMEWAKYVVAAGTILGLSSSMLGVVYVLTRGVYAMAENGLLFGFLAYIHPKTQTPVLASTIFGGLSAAVAAVGNFEMLLGFTSMGTLFTFTMVSFTIVIFRYTPVQTFQLQQSNEEAARSVQKSEKTPILTKCSYQDVGKLRPKFRNVPILRHFSPGQAVKMAMACLLVLITALSGALVYGQGNWWAVIVIVLLIIGITFFYLVIVVHERYDTVDMFQVPCVPLLPLLSIMFNITLMMLNNLSTWLRLGVGILVGIVLYFAYGIHFSLENQTSDSTSESINTTQPQPAPEHDTSVPPLPSTGQYQGVYPRKILSDVTW